jgi:hypothetical protein
MNTTIKLLNDNLVCVCRILNKLFESRKPFEYILNNTAEIDMALTDASETLATITPETNRGITWAYNNGSDNPSCPDGSCAWDNR